MRPNYSKIYHDMLRLEHPDKLEEPKIKELLKRLNTSDDVLKFNERIFEQSKESSKNNQKLKTYDKKTMLKLLQYQKKHGFSTSYMSKKYKISRTTIAKWKKNFEEEIS
ncbi:MULTISPECIES: helix-turn-helix domain-containing protein [Chryseobacterium]|uniref:helix-turn-helix domain-containing protein n=1 Tax=Chryseobacterium TaxID=59732 RepID=UPI001553F5FF|nr:MULTISPECIES: helix-turn-helix domain-containing protein [unclassified Chryseobacterium]MDC8106752.1 helix-turn-helix domain-containing protein [Chryseobacterium sp. B21-037]MDQ1805972.1 helix-turn-helix domain-containing protein [Chryseobacterium sp. CKR4-1]WBV55952.1 helix-turn-helix domain-containing protein [Chryseobacterium daecheongense]